ncbi:MAG: hypothetical protein L0271_19320, partial [Gemmatimonadetes bacterium]|nr:hypothetical protein [Gemmatimonadota bacterium]
LVVRLHFPFLEVPARHPSFVERSTIETIRRPTVATPSEKPAAPVTQSPVPRTLMAHERPPSPAVEQQPFFQ